MRHVDVEIARVCVCDCVCEIARETEQAAKWAKLLILPASSCLELLNHAPVFLFLFLVGNVVLYYFTSFFSLLLGLPLTIETPNFGGLRF